MATPVPDNQEADRDACDVEVDSTCCEGCIGEHCNCRDGCNYKCNDGQTNEP